ncbi:helix-turn-helix domain-containing protein [Salipiger sp. PrR003]|uniref:helix-turn-helix domain-containing protein n=1 Tax=Salipiger sp. PrR003 TaxID=2706776 RepID=UPI001F436DA2|nr:helix-turn-helix domain-containing protein [Salipiger sp. PrR003]
MAVTRLLPIPEAADMLGVPPGSLRTAADKHGKTIRMGRAVRLHPDDLEELCKLCRDDPKAPAFTGEKDQAEPHTGKSGTPEMSGSRRALTAAQKLKKLSKTTSTVSSAQVVPLGRRN